MLVFIAVLAGIFGIGIMQLILAAALPYIVLDLGGDYLYSWVFSAYMLASLLSIPIFSKLADQFGRKRFYLIGASLFGAGSLLGAFAPSMEVLVAGRIIQGLGAGILAPVSLALITDIFPKEKRGSMIGIFGFVQLAANLVSPPLGAFITKHLGWNWVFILNLGFIGSAALIILFSGGLKKNITGAAAPAGQAKRVPVDIKGSLLFGLFCVLTVGFSKLLTEGTTKLWLLAVLPVVIIAALFLLIRIESRQEDPVLKKYFFTNPDIRRSIISSIMSGAVMYSLITMLPLMEMVSAQNNAQLNHVFLFFMLGITVGLLTFGRTAGNEKLYFIPRLLWGVGTFAMLSLLFFMTSRLIFIICITAGGLAIGGVMATFLIRSQNSAESANRTAISGIIQLGRYFGAAIGVSLVTSLIPAVKSLGAFSDFLKAIISLSIISAAGFINEFF